MLLRSSWMKSRTPLSLRTPILIGVEQEFDLFNGERYIDFRKLFSQVVAHTRSVPFRNCDSAVILEAGYMLACDGWEAEFATAPISSAGNGPAAVAHEVVRCRMHMLQLLKRVGVRQVRGYSTHINISVPIGREWELAWAFAESVAPALILLMEARQSPGLLIRPRRGRLEIGSEYLDDEGQLAAAIVFLTGVIHAYPYNQTLWKQFPRVRLKKWEDANIRPGIYLPHDAYGESMHELGRKAQIELESGEKITAGKILESCAELVLRELNKQVSERALKTLRRVVQQTGSLQIEQEQMPGDIQRRAVHFSVLEAKTIQSLASSHSRLGITPAFVDWEGVAFSWTGKNVPLILGIPWSDLPQFFTIARKNDIPQYVASLGPPEAALTSLNQLRSAQTYERVDPVALGTQALNDKGMHAGVKGGASKPPKQIEYVAVSQNTSLQSPLESESLAQTIIARRSPVQTDLAQTLISRRPILAQGGTANAAAATSSGRVGWIIGAVVTAIVVLSVLAAGIGIVVLSHMTQPTATPTLISEGAPVFSQGISALTNTPIPSQAISTPTLGLTSAPSCIPGPMISFPPNGMTLITRSVLLQWTYTSTLTKGQVFVVLISTNPDNLQGPNSATSIVGKTTSQSLGVNLPGSQNLGNAGGFYWLVRIMSTDQQFVDCPAKPSYFQLQVIPTKTPTMQPTHHPYWTATLLP